MKKILTVIALASASATIAAAPLDFSVEANPAPGTVPELTAIEVNFPNLSEIELNSDTYVTLTRDEENIPITTKAPYGGTTIISTLKERQVTPGTYTLTIAAGAIAGYDEEYNTEDNPSPITLNYIIEAAEKDMYSFTVTPAESEVTELSKVSFKFPELDEVELIDDEYAEATFNGTPISGVKAAAVYGTNTFNFTLPETMSNPGTYVFTIKAGGLDGYIYDYENEENTEYFSNEKDITMTYTIVGTGNELDFTVTPTPSNEGIVSKLDKVLLTFSGLESIQKPTVFDVKVDGTNLAADKYTVAAAGNILEVNIAPAITEGKVEFFIPADGVKGTKGNVTAANKQSVSVAYTVAGPVVYDYETVLSSPTKPNANGEISAEKSISSFFFSTPTPYLYCADGTTPNVTIKEVNGDYEASARLRKANGISMATTSYFFADFGSEPAYNGEYIVTIEQGAYGNSVWFDNREYGRSNAKVELRFTLVDGRERDRFTIEPTSVTPAAGEYKQAKDLETVTVTFEGDVKLVSGAYATLAGIDTDFATQASFTETATPGVFTATFATLPTASGSYVMTVNSGSFGNTDFVSSNGTKGLGSKPIQVNYTLTLNNGIDSIAVDAAQHGVYSVTGVYMGTSIENLPAGIYIINGRKMIVK